MPASKSSLSAGAMRSTSEELGESDWSTTYNPRTGRPVRRSAGRKSLVKGFTNSADAISDDESLSEQDPDEPRPKPKKRKRTPSPPMSPAPVVDDEDPDVLERPVRRESTKIAETSIPPISLTFNVPRGHAGAFVVNLDVNSLVRQALPHSSSPSPQPSLSQRASPSVVSNVASQSCYTNGKVGFLTLPAELRNEIYRMVLVDEKKFDFGAPKNFAHSAALLRTCRQIQSEAASILYSENVFYLRRNSRSRTPRWTTEGREIGFRDLHLFLKNIGATNVSLLRQVIILFEDAVPSLNPHLTTAEERRFVQDDYLMASLKILAKHGRLRKLELAPFGRRNVAEADLRFVTHLKALRADTVEFVDHPEYPNAYVSQIRPKIVHYMQVELAKSIARKHRFYNEELPPKRELVEKAKSKPVCTWCGKRHG